MTQSYGTANEKIARLEVFFSLFYLFIFFLSNFKP